MKITGDSIGLLIGLGFLGYGAFSLMRMIAVALRTGKAELWMGNIRSARRGPPMSRAVNPRGFWAIIGWYGFLTLVLIALAIAAVIGSGVLK